MIANFLCASELEYRNNDASLLLTEFYTNSLSDGCVEAFTIKEAELKLVFYVRSDLISVRLLCPDKLTKKCKMFHVKQNTIEYLL